MKMSSPLSSSTLSKKTLLASIVLSMSVGITACSDQKNETVIQSSDTATEAAPSNKLQTKFVTIATGGASGPYNIIGTSLSEIYAKTFGVNSKTQTTGASVENINLLSKGKVDMAFVMSDVVTDAVKGVNNFSAPVSNIQQIAVMYPNVMQVATAKNSGINTIEDLKGKRIAVGDQGSGTEVNARSLLNEFGITYEDVKVDYLSFAEAADAMKAGKIDAAFFNSGLPNSSIMELEQGFDLKIVSVDQEKIKEIMTRKPYFNTFKIPAGTYGNAEPVPTVAIMNALLVSSNLSEEDGYKLTKALFDNLDGLKNAHQAASAISLAEAQKGMVAPIHPGAKKFYDEQASN